MQKIIQCNLSIQHVNDINMPSLNLPGNVPDVTACGIHSKDRFLIWDARYPPWGHAGRIRERQTERFNSRPTQLLTWIFYHGNPIFGWWWDLECFWNPQNIWLVVSTHLKNICQNGNLPQIGVKIENIYSKYNVNIWNHHLDIAGKFCSNLSFVKSAEIETFLLQSSRPLSPEAMKIR